MSSCTDKIRKILSESSRGENFCIILKSILPYKTVNYLFIYKGNKEHDVKAWTVCVIRAFNETKGEMKSAWKMCGAQ